MKKEKKIRWIKWDHMEVPKKKGRMGYKNIESFNQALLAKQGWRLVTNSSSLVAIVLKAKYFKNDSFLDAGSMSIFDLEKYLGGEISIKRMIEMESRKW